MSLSPRAAAKRVRSRIVCRFFAQPLLGGPRDDSKGLPSDHMQGKVSFEAFISWWSRRSCWLLPYDRFYKKVRDLSSLSPDPPVRDQLGLSEQPGDDGAEEDEEAEGEQEEEEEEEHFLEQSQQDSW